MVNLALNSELSNQEHTYKLRSKLHDWVFVSHSTQNNNLVVWHTPWSCRFRHWEYVYMIWLLINLCALIYPFVHWNVHASNKSDLISILQWTWLLTFISKTLLAPRHQLTLRLCSIVGVYHISATEAFLRSHVTTKLRLLQHLSSIKYEMRQEAGYVSYSWLQSCFSIAVGIFHGVMWHNRCHFLLYTVGVYQNIM